MGGEGGGEGERCLGDHLLVLRLNGRCLRHLPGAGLHKSTRLVHKMATHTLQPHTQTHTHMHSHTHTHTHTHTPDLSYLSQYGPGTGRQWLDFIDCTGEEDSIFNCSNGGLGQTVCGHQFDLGVVCEGEGAANDAMMLAGSKTSFTKMFSCGPRGSDVNMVFT